MAENLTILPSEAVELLGLSNGTPCENESLLNSFKHNIARDPVVVRAVADNAIDNLKKNAKRLRQEKTRDVYIPELLTTSEQTALVTEFGDYNLTFGRKACAHAFARAHRHLETLSIMDRLKYSKNLRLTAGVRAYIKDIGGNAAYHLRNLHRFVHSCAPILNYADSIRDREYATARSLAVADSRLVTDAQSRRFVMDHVECRPNVVCSNTAQNCDVRAPFAMMIHSIYDMTPTEVADSMERAGASQAYGTMMFDPLIYLEKSGSIDVLRVRWRVIEGVRPKIEFSFVGDTQNVYVHDYANYVGWFRTFVIYSSDHAPYHFNIEKYMNGVVTFSVGKITSMLPAEDVSRRFYMPESDLLALNCVDYDTVGKDVFGTQHISRRRIYLRRSTFETLMSYVYQLSEGKFTFYNVRRATTALVKRVSLNGQHMVTRDADLSPRDIGTLSVALYLTGYVYSYEQTSALAAVKSDEDQIRRCYSGGVSGMLAYFSRAIKWRPGIFDERELNDGLVARLLQALKAERRTPITVDDVLSVVSVSEIVSAVGFSPVFMCPVTSAEVDCNLAMEDAAVAAVRGITTGVALVVPSGVPTECPGDFVAVPNAGQGACLYHALRDCGAVNATPQAIRDALLTSSHLNTLVPAREIVARLSAPFSSEAGWGDTDVLYLACVHYRITVCLHAESATGVVCQLFNPGHKTFHIRHRDDHFEALMPALPDVPITLIERSNETVVVSREVDLTLPVNSYSPEDVRALNPLREYDTLGYLDRYGAIACEMIQRFGLEARNAFVIDHRFGGVVEAVSGMGCPVVYYCSDAKSRLNNYSNASMLRYDSVASPDCTEIYLAYSEHCAVEGESVDLIVDFGPDFSEGPCPTPFSHRGVYTLMKYMSVDGALMVRVQNIDEFSKFSAISSLFQCLTIVKPGTSRPTIAELYLLFTGYTPASYIPHREHYVERDPCVLRGLSEAFAAARERLSVLPGTLASGPVETCDRYLAIRATGRRTGGYLPPPELVTAIVSKLNLPQYSRRAVAAVLFLLAKSFSLGNVSCRMPLVWMSGVGDVAPSVLASIISAVKYVMSLSYHLVEIFLTYISKFVSPYAFGLFASVRSTIVCVTPACVVDALRNASDNMFVIAVASGLRRCVDSLAVVVRPVWHIVPVGFFARVFDYIWRLIWRVPAGEFVPCVPRTLLWKFADFEYFDVPDDSIGLFPMCSAGADRVAEIVSDFRLGIDPAVGVVQSYCSRMFGIGRTAVVDPVCRATTVSVSKGLRSCLSSLFSHAAAAGAAVLVGYAVTEAVCYAVGVEGPTQRTLRHLATARPYTPAIDGVERISSTELALRNVRRPMVMPVVDVNDNLTVCGSDVTHSSPVNGGVVRPPAPVMPPVHADVFRDFVEYSTKYVSVSASNCKLAYSMIEGKSLEVIRSYKGCNILPPGVNVYDPDAGKCIFESPTIDLGSYVYAGDYVRIGDARGLSVVDSYCKYKMEDDLIKTINTLLKSNRPPRVTDMGIVQAAPGCGKTYHIIENCSNILESVILCSTRAGAADLRQRYAARWKTDQSVLNDRIRVIQSFLLKPLRCERLFIDEAFMQHPGMILAAIYLSECSFVRCMGDVLQIPFVCRVPEYVVRYDSLSSVIEIRDVLYVTRRCPVDVAARLHYDYFDSNSSRGHYGKGMDSTVHIPSSCHVHRIPTIESVPVTDAQYLVFKQADKILLGNYLKSKGKSGEVFTVHEYQGKEADHIIVVRLSVLIQDEIFLRRPYAVVAITRHRRRLDYYTCLAHGSDELSTLIESVPTQSEISSRLRVSGGAVHGTAIDVFAPVANAALGVRSEGSINIVPYRTVRPERIGSTLRIPWSWTRKSVSGLVSSLRPYIKYGSAVRVAEDITSAYDYSGLYSRLYKHLTNKIELCTSDPAIVPYQVFEFMNQNGYHEPALTVRERICDFGDAVVDGEGVVACAGTEVDVQMMLDLLQPRGLSTEYDIWLVHHSPLDLVIDNLSLVPFAAPYSAPAYDCLTPVIESSAPGIRPVTLRESLLALAKRNKASPELMADVDHLHMVQRMCDTFFDSYLRSDTCTSSIVPSSTAVAEWLRGQKLPSLDVILDELPIHEKDLASYDFSIKRSPKPSLVRGAYDVYAALQTIVCHDKNVNTLFCPIFGAIRDRILDGLYSKFRIYTSCSPAEFASSLDRYGPLLVDPSREKLEIDISKYDKSQGLLTLLFECEMMRRFGVADEFVKLWYGAHLITRLRDRATSLSTTVALQRKSGDASTFLGNTMFLMAVLAISYDMRSVDLALFAGDDSLLIGRALRESTDSLRMSMLFGLECKALFANYSYFCSKYLYVVDGHVYFSPDPLKLAVKLGRRDIRNYEHLKEYHTSYSDLVVDFKSYVVCRALSRCMSERHSIDYDFSIAISALYSFTDYETFSSLFYVKPGAVLLEDPSRPRLD